MTRDQLTIAFTGGGTAGHVFPGLAVIEELKKLGFTRFFWIGARGGVERGMVEAAGLEFNGIPAGKLRRYLSVRNITDIARVFAGIVSSFFLLLRKRPAFLFSKGGFVSVPPVLAARLCGIPSWTHESDFDPGLATRINLRSCEKVLVSFPQTRDFLPPQHAAKAVVTGNPVRGAIFHADAGRGRKHVGCPDQLPLIFVIGGSSGSSSINRLVADSLSVLLARAFVVHQMGRKEYVPSSNARYFSAPFFSEELPDIMAAADLVISRSGANVLAELAALGKPSLLIPLPTSGSRGDQLRNAEVFRANGAALVLPEESLTPADLCSTVFGLLDDSRGLSRMGDAALALARGNAAATIAEMIAGRIG